jgi:hypothetical protein
VGFVGKETKECAQSGKKTLKRFASFRPMEKDLSDKGQLSLIALRLLRFTSLFLLILHRIF